MALYGALAKDKHLSELSEPLNIGQGVKTPATRRLEALRNLTGDDNVTLADITKLAATEAVIASAATAAAHQADLGDAASGAEIATAVNGLRDALVTFGIMAAAE